jgi:hypothetical protein
MDVTVYSKSIKRKSLIKRKYKRNNKKSRKIRGGCGCQSSSFKGGNINPASFDGSLPYRYYYGQNDYNGDPSSVIENARNLPAIHTIGGMRNKKLKKTVQRLKMKGGDMLLGSAYSSNPFLTFGTIDGATNSANIITGSQSVNSSIYDQPTLSGFNNYNPRLV